MSLYDNVKQAAKSKGYSINRLEQELGFARSYISKFKTITPSADKIQKIADFLGVSSEYLLTGEEEQGLITCKECGLMYNSSDPSDIKIHQKQHEAYEKAKKKFGTIYGYYPERERIKAENRSIYENNSLPLEQRYNAQLEILRCLFSRSLEACTYDLNHVDYETYVSMMLKNNSYGPKLDDKIFLKLKNKFGTLPGIDNGTFYHIPSVQRHTLAAHFDGDEYTEDELDEIRQFAEFVKTKRQSDL